MQRISINKFIWKFNKRENVLIGLHEDLLYRELGIYHGTVNAKAKLRKHFHKRPDNGKEIFFFYRGGHFIIELDNRQEEYDSEEPVYVVFSNEEIHGFINLKDEILEFQVIYCPDFQQGEVFHS